MLRSSSVVQDIAYKPYEVAYRTFDADGTQTLRLTFKPCAVLAEGVPLPQRTLLTDQPGWTFDASLNVLTIRPGSRKVSIAGR